MVDLRADVLADVNWIREMAGVPLYLTLPDKDDPIRYALEHLFGADAWNITPQRIEWMQLDAIDLEEDAMTQYETRIVQTVETPDSFLRYYFE